jgi:hypothetical protein
VRAAVARRHDLRDVLGQMSGCADRVFRKRRAPPSTTATSSRHLSASHSVPRQAAPPTANSIGRPSRLAYPLKLGWHLDQNVRAAAQADQDIRGTVYDARSNRRRAATSYSDRAIGRQRFATHTLTTKSDAAGSLFTGKRALNQCRHLYGFRLVLTGCLISPCNALDRPGAEDKLLSKGPTLIFARLHEL